MLSGVGFTVCCYLCHLLCRLSEVLTWNNFGPLLILRGPIIRSKIWGGRNYRVRNVLKTLLKNVPNKMKGWAKSKGSKLTYVGADITKIQTKLTSF